MDAKMKPSIKKALETAFRSKDTSLACLAVADLFSKDQTPRTMSSIMKKVKLSEERALVTLDRLLYEAKILDYEPEFRKKESKVVFKHGIRPEYVK